MLEQFERNADQQNFLLMIFEKLDERTSQVVTPPPSSSLAWHVGCTFACQRAC